jgi:hypothetical protein
MIQLNYPEAQVIRKTFVPLFLGLALALGCSEQTPLQPEIQKNSTINAKTATPHNSEQVVFSGVAAIGSTFGSPVGFWIWCEAESENSYDEECNGSMYFYDLGITRHVEGEITEPSDGLYEMTVSSTLDDKILTCVLKNEAEAVRGPHNVVDVDCGTPAGHAQSQSAVVVVTGPPGS